MSTCPPNVKAALMTWKTNGSRSLAGLKEILTGLDLKDPDIGGRALLFSCWFVDVDVRFDCVTWLVQEEGVDVHGIKCCEAEGGSDPSTALIWAFCACHLELIRFLISRGADVNARDGGHASCLVALFYHAHVHDFNGDDLIEIAKLAVLSGADLSMTNRDGVAALSQIGGFSFQKKEEIMDFLRNKAPLLAKRVTARASKMTKVEESKAQDPTAAGDNTPHIMLSYNWGHQETVVRLKAELEGRGFKVWLDVEQMAGSTLEAMAEAVEGASVVVFGASSGYQNSANCRLEGEYALVQKKTMVPLMMESGFRATGWLGMMMGTKLWHDFSDEAKFSGAVNGLVKELEKATGNKTIPAASAPAPAPASDPTPAPAPEPAAEKLDDVAEMNVDDVNEWLKEVGLGGIATRLTLTEQPLDGSGLRFLADATQKDSPITTINWLVDSGLLERKSPAQNMRFVFQVRKLCGLA